VVIYYAQEAFTAHGNARLTFGGRCLLVRRVRDGRAPVAHVPSGWRMQTPTSSPGSPPPAAAGAAAATATRARRPPAAAWAYDFARSAVDDHSRLA